MQQYRLHTKQRGAIGIMGAVTLIIVVAMLVLVIDSSRLYLERRNLQRVADLAALEAASRGGICHTQGQMTQTLAEQAARQSAQRNGFNPTASNRTLTSVIGIIEQDSTGHRRLASVQTGKPVDGVQVTVTHRVPSSIVANLASLFPGGQTSSQTTLGATATAQRMAQASFSVGSGLLSLVSSNSPLLNPILNGLLDGDVDLTVLTPQGIAAANVELLSFLELLRTEAKIGSIEELLKTDIGVLPFVSVVGGLINQKASVNTNLNQARLLAAGPVGVTLGQLLGLRTATSREALKSSVNLVELLTMGAVVANGTRSVDLDMGLLALPDVYKLISNNSGNINPLPSGGLVPNISNLPYTSPLVKAQLLVTEPPQYAYGPPGLGSDGKWLTQAKTGQVDLVLTFNSQPLSILNVGGLIKVKLDMAVRVRLASGNAVLKSISCSNPYKVTVGLESEVDSVTITKANSLDPAEVRVTIADSDLVHLKIRTKSNLLGKGNSDLVFDYNPVDKTFSPTTQKINSPINLQLPVLEVSNSEPLYQTEKKKCTGILVGLLCTVGSIVDVIVSPVVAGLFDILGNLTNVTNVVLNAISKLLLDPLLNLLGIKIGYAEVTMHGVDQVPAQLVR